MNETTADRSYVKNGTSIFATHGPCSVDNPTLWGLRRIFSPEGSRDTVVEGDVGRLEQSRGPGPLGHDHRRRKPGLNAAPGGVELLAVVVVVVMYNKRFDNIRQ